MHELGHYVNGDLEVSTEVANERLSSRMAGEIQSYELDADEYAANQLSDKELSDTISYLYRLSDKTSTIVDNWVEIGRIDSEQEKIERFSIYEVKYRAKLLTRILYKRKISKLFSKWVH